MKKVRFSGIDEIFHIPPRDEKLNEHKPLIKTKILIPSQPSKKSKLSYYFYILLIFIGIILILIYILKK